MLTVVEARSSDQTLVVEFPDGRREEVRRQGWARSKADRIDRFEPGSEVMLRDAPDGGSPLRVIHPASDPWLEFARTTAVGQLVEATVADFDDGAALVRLDNGLRGRVARDELAWEPLEHPSVVTPIGARVALAVLEIDAVRGVVDLSLKRRGTDRFGAFAAQASVGQAVEGVVIAVTDQAAFVELAPDVTGRLDVTELAWVRIDRVSDVLREGDPIAVQIIGFDVDRGLVGVSTKRLLPDPFIDFVARTAVGQAVEGEVTDVTDRAASVALAPGVAGRLDVSELAWEQLERASDVLRTGDRIAVRVIYFDAVERIVGLSTKRLRSHW